MDVKINLSADDKKTLKDLILEAKKVMEIYSTNLKRFNELVPIYGMAVPINRLKRPDVVK